MQLLARKRTGATSRRSFTHSRGYASTLLRLLIFVAVSLGQLIWAAPLKRWNDVSYYVTSWQTDHGLPQNSIITIQQTQDGYLWMGTFNGLVRFDGIRFQIYNSHTTPELGSSRVLLLHEGSSGHLWIATENGSLVRMKGGKFSKVEFGRQSSRPLIIAMAEDRTGRLWFTTGDGTLHYYQEGLVISAEHGVREEWSKTVFKNSRGELCLLTMNGLYIFNENDQKFHFISRTADILQNSQIVIPGRTGNFYAASAGKIFKFNKEGLEKEIGPIPFTKAGLTLLFEDSKTNLWAGSYGSGLVRYDAQGVATEFNEKDGISHNTVRTLFEDKEGNLWIGTDGGGLNRMTENKFDIFDKQSGLSENVVLSIAEDKEGGLWIGSNGGGIDYFKDGVTRNFGAAEGLNSPHVWSILCDSRNRIWAGTWGAGVFRLENGRFHPVKEVPPALASIALALFEDRRGRIWIGTQAGVVSFDGEYATRFTTMDGLPNNDIRAIKEDKAGNIWLGSNGGGLIRYNGTNFHAWRQKDGLVDDAVWSLHIDSEDNIWVGTFGGGLARFQDGKFLPVNPLHALQGNVICHIAEDSWKNFWISSYNGLFKVPKESLMKEKEANPGLRILSYDKDDGLPSREFTGGFQPAGITTSDGSLLFPTIRGLVKVNPAKMELLNTDVNMAVEDVLIDGERLDIPSGNRRAGGVSSPRITFPAGRERLEIHYTALSFTAPEKINFKYRLAGLEQQWVDAGLRRVAYYSHLPSGDYTFELKAANRDGIWSHEQAFMTVTVHPPFWRTWWFFALVAMGGGALITGIMRYVEITKLRRQMQRLEQQHAIEKERSRIAKDIHDDVGASLTQITLLSELARSDLDKPQQAEEHIRQISSTAREVTRSMDEIVWAVNPQNDTLEDLISYTTKSAHDYLQIARIRFRLDLPNQLPPIPLTTETRHNVFLVIREALNNVVKHAHATEVWLRVTLEPDAFTITVEDDGIGFRRAQSIPSSENDRIAHGNGLRNMHKRIDEIGGEFSVSSKEDKGSIVTLTVPFPAVVERLNVRSLIREHQI